MSNVYKRCALVLGGEVKTHYRVDRALDLLNKEEVDFIYVTGGTSGSGLKTEAKAIAAGEYGPTTEADINAEYLVRARGVPAQLVKINSRGRETMGNIAFTLCTPLADSRPHDEDHPRLDSLDKIVLVTESGHMPFVKDLAPKIIPEEKVEYRETDPGKEQSDVAGYQPGIVEKVYHKALMHALRKIKEPDPQAVLAFLDKHPFYGKTWYSKNWDSKQGITKNIITGLKALQWLTGFGAAKPSS